MLTRRSFLKTSAGGLAGAALWQMGCGGGGNDGGTQPVAGIYGVGQAYLAFDDSGDVFEIEPIFTPCCAGGRTARWSGRSASSARTPASSTIRPRS